MQWFRWNGKHAPSGIGPSVPKEPMTQYGRARLGRKSIKMGLFYIYIHTSDFGAELRSNNATQGAKPG